MAKSLQRITTEVNKNTKPETLSRHFILGPNGLRGQWLPPSSDKWVQYPSNINFTPVEIPSGGSDSLGFSTPFLSMTSFAFFSSGTVEEQGNCALDLSANISSVDLGHRDSSLCIGNESREMEDKAAQTKRAGGTSWSVRSSIHKKRNRTIGHGEFEQLNLMMTESVIRWASCTHLPTATSLRSSLVC